MTKEPTAHSGNEVSSVGGVRTTGRPNQRQWACHSLGSWLTHRHHAAFPGASLYSASRSGRQIGHLKKNQIGSTIYLKMRRDRRAIKVQGRELQSRRSQTRPDAGRGRRPRRRPRQGPRPRKRPLSSWAPGPGQRRPLSSRRFRKDRGKRSRTTGRSIFNRRGRGLPFA